MNNEAVLDRADFLERNKAELARLMRESAHADPVGVVADVRTFHGRQFALAVGLTEDVIDRDAAGFLADQKIPTVMAVINWKAAEAMMPHTSPTASRNLAAAKTICKAEGASLMIAIMGEGNRYEVVKPSGDGSYSLAGENGRHVRSRPHCPVAATGTFPPPFFSQQISTSAAYIFVEDI